MQLPDARTKTGATAAVNGASRTTIGGRTDPLAQRRDRGALASEPAVLAPAPAVPARHAGPGQDAEGEEVFLAVLATHRENDDGHCHG